MLNETGKFIAILTCPIEIFQAVSVDEPKINGSEERVSTNEPNGYFHRFHGGW